MKKLRYRSACDGATKPIEYVKHGPSAIPWCATPGGTDVESNGHGVVYSWVTVHRQLTVPRDVPYTVATVQLDDGPRMLGRLDGQAAADARVEPAFVDHDDWTELRFRVVP